MRGHDNNIRVSDDVRRTWGYHTGNATDTRTFSDDNRYRTAASANANRSRSDCAGPGYPVWYRRAARTNPWVILFSQAPVTHLSCASRPTTPVSLGGVDFLVSYRFTRYVTPFKYVFIFSTCCSHDSTRSPDRRFRRMKTS